MQKVSKFVFAGALGQFRTVFRHLSAFCHDSIFLGCPMICPLQSQRLSEILSGFSVFLRIRFLTLDSEESAAKFSEPFPLCAPSLYPSARMVAVQERKDTGQVSLEHPADKQGSTGQCTGRKSRKRRAILPGRRPGTPGRPAGFHVRCPYVPFLGFLQNPLFGEPVVCIPESRVFCCNFLGFIDLRQSSAQHPHSRLSELSLSF